jgi:hypothetical protein
VGIKSMPHHMKRPEKQRAATKSHRDIRSYSQEKHQPAYPLPRIYKSSQWTGLACGFALPASNKARCGTRLVGRRPVLLAQALALIHRITNTSRYTSALKGV